jgi:hypothetical protein
MSALDIVIFVLILLALAGGMYWLHRIDVNTKNKNKMIAYKLLDDNSQDARKLKETLTMLHLYRGRWRKDPEFVQLIKLISEQLDEAVKANPNSNRIIFK